MLPDREQLERVRAIAIRGSLRVRDVDLDAFVAGYRPVICRGLVVPPSFVWLDALCAPEELERIWILRPLPSDGTSADAWNLWATKQAGPWPAYLLPFGFTGDESFCFAYGAPDVEPAIVTVDSYYSPRDEDDEPYVDWDWADESFEKWLSATANWLLESDAKLAKWNERARE